MSIPSLPAGRHRASSDGWGTARGAGNDTACQPAYDAGREAGQDDGSYEGRHYGASPTRRGGYEGRHRIRHDAEFVAAQSAG